MCTQININNKLQLIAINFFPNFTVPLKFITVFMSLSLCNMLHTSVDKQSIWAVTLAKNAAGFLIYGKISPFNATWE